MNEAERRRRLEAWALQNNTQPLQVSTAQPQRKVVVEPSQPQRYKVSVSPTVQVKPKVSVVTPFLRPTNGPLPDTEFKAFTAKTNKRGFLPDQTQISIDKSYITNKDKFVADFDKLSRETRNIYYQTVREQAKKGDMAAANALKALQETNRVPRENTLERGAAALSVPGRSILRVATGVPQALSGAYDLVTPGKGTSRVSKAINKVAEVQDQSAKEANVNAAYKVGNVGGELALIAASGGALAGVKAPGYAAKFTGFVSKLSKGNKAQKLAAKALNPADAANEALFTSKYISEDVARGNEITPERVALDVATGVGGNVAANTLLGWFGVVLGKANKLDDTILNFAKETDATKIESEIRTLVPDLDDSTVKQVSEELAGATTTEDVVAILNKTTPAQTASATDDVVEQLAKTKTPEEVRSAVDALFPTLPEGDKSILSTKLAQLTKTEDIRKAIQIAEQRQNQLKQATEQATPQGKPVDTATQQEQALQEATPQPVPSNVVDEPIPTAEPVSATPTAVADATTTADIPQATADISPEAMQTASTGIKDKNKRTFWEKVGNFVKTQWDPRAEARRLDKELEKKLGRKLLPSEKSEDAVQFSGTAGERSAQYVDKSPLGKIVQKYGYGTDGERDFVSYLAYQRDLEIRNDGGQPLLNGTVEDLQRNIAELEAKYPGIREDGLAVTQGYVKQLQEMAATGEDAFVSIDELNKVRTKRDGTEYQWYAPVSRPLPEGTVRPEVDARNLGSIAQDRVLQSREATGPIDPTFDALREMSDIVHKQQGQARVARTIANATEQGVGASRFIKTAEQDAFIKQARQNLKEVREYITSLKKQAPKTRRKAVKIGQKARQAEKQVVDSAKQQMRTQSKAIADDIRKEIASAKVKLKVQKAKLGLPKYKKTQAEGEAVARARQELNKSLLSDDARAAAGALTKEDLLEVFDAMANDAPLPSNVLSIFRKVAKTDKAYNDLVDDISGTTQQITDAKEKLVSAIASTKETADKIRSMSKEDYIAFVENVINNEQATKAQVAKYNRYKQSRQDLAYAIDDYEQLKNEIDLFDNQAKGIQEEVANLGIDSTTGLQVIRGIDANGNQFVIEVTPELATLIQGIGNKKYNEFIKTGRAIQAPFRQVFTGIANPSFQAKQAIWNALLVPITSERGFKVYAPSAIKAGFSAVNNSSEWQQNLTKWGVNRYASDLHKLANDDTIAAVAANKDLISKIKWYNPFTKGGIQRSWGAINELGGKIDQIYRSAAAKAEYDAVLKQTGSEREAQLAAAKAFNTVLPDFSNVSQQIKAIDAIIPYTAAGQAGTRTFLRAVKDQPLKNGAILAMYASPAIALTAYNYSHAAGEEFYRDMEENGKGYILDTNAILVLPGAHKDEESGEWVGVIKVPVPPEFRPATKAIRTTFTSAENNTGVPIGTYARATFDTFTGGSLVQAKSPAIDTAVGLATGKDPQYGNDVYDPNATTSEKIKQGTGYALGKFGTAGKAVLSTNLGDVLLPASAKEGTSPLQVYKDSFVNTFYGAKGSTAGSRYYKARDEAIKEAGLNKNQLNTFNGLIAPTKEDLTGENIQSKSFWNTSAKANAWLNDLQGGNGALWKASKLINDKLKASGKASDPLYDLTGEQLITVLGLMANPSPGNKEEKAIQELQPWVKDFYEKRNNYFDAVFGDQEGKDYTGVTIPKADKKLQAKIDALNKMPKESKYQFTKDNPDIADYFASQDAYQRYKRSVMGLPQFDAYPKASPEVQKLMDTYNALPKGNGPAKKDGTASSPDRSAWIKANPEKWALMTDQWLKQNIYNLQGEAALAVYEGIDIDQKTLDRLSGNQTGGFRVGGGAQSNRIGLSELLQGVQPGRIKATEVVDATPRKVRFKAKLPSSGKGRSYKRIRLQ